MAFIQSVKGTTNSTSTTTPAFASTPTAGNRIVVAVGYAAGTATNVSSVTDSGGNTYLRAGGIVDVGVTNAVECWYTYNLTSHASFTVTVNFASGTQNSVIAQEFGSNFTTNPLDQFTATSLRPNSTSPISGATTSATTYLSEDVIAIAQIDAGSVGYGLGTGYSNLAEQTAVSAYDLAMESNSVTTTGTQAASFTATSPNAFVFLIATFKSYTYNPAKNIGQSLTLSTTNADILTAAVSLPSLVTPASTSVAMTLTSDGTNFESFPNQSSPAQIFTNIGSNLKWKATLTGTSGATPTVKQVSVTYNVGIALDATTKYAAQSFTPLTTGNVQRLDLFETILGSPGNFTLRIETDAAGSPSGTLAAGAATLTGTAASLNSAGLAAGQYLVHNFASSFSLTAGTKYWIVYFAAATLNTTNKYLLFANNNRYAGGAMKRSTNSGGSYSGFASAEELMFVFYQASGGNYNVDFTLPYVKRYL